MTEEKMRLINDRLDYTKHIQITAKNLFLDTQLIKIPVDRGYSFIIQNEELVQKVMSIVGDSGLLYMTTWENLAELWASFREMDDYGVAQWILQTSTSFRILGFDNPEAYSWWVDQLTHGYCSHVEPTSYDQISSKDAEKSLALDDEYSDRLPRSVEYKNLLHANPWFVYLVTLQLSYHELYKEIVASEYELDGIRRITGVEKNE